MAREEGVRRSPELAPDSFPRGGALVPQYSALHRELFTSQITCGPMTGSGMARQPEGTDFQSYLSVDGTSKSYSARKEEDPEWGSGELDGICTEGLLKSRKAVLPSEIRRRERSVEDPRRGHREEEPRARRAIQKTGSGTPEEHVYSAQGSGVRQGRARDSRRQGNTSVYPKREPEAFKEKPKTLIRSISDAPVSSPRVAVFQEAEQGPDEGMVFCGALANGEHVALDTGVSVAQLRLSYLESTGVTKNPELYVVQYGVRVGPPLTVTPSGQPARFNAYAVHTLTGMSCLCAGAPRTGEPLLRVLISPLGRPAPLPDPAAARGPQGAHPLCMGLTCWGMGAVLCSV